MRAGDGRVAGEGGAWTARTSWCQALPRRCLPPALGTKYLKNGKIPTATAALFTKPNATASPVQVLQANNVAVAAGDSRVLAAAYSGGYVYATMNSALKFSLSPTTTVNRVRGQAGGLGGRRAGGGGCVRAGHANTLFRGRGRGERGRQSGPDLPRYVLNPPMPALLLTAPAPHHPAHARTSQNAIAYFVYNPDTGVNKYSG